MRVWVLVMMNDEVPMAMGEPLLALSSPAAVGAGDCGLGRGGGHSVTLCEDAVPCPYGAWGRSGWIGAVLLGGWIWWRGCFRAMIGRSDADLWRGWLRW